MVLFPGVRTPLRIFEPRYRQMTSDVLAGSRRLGMVTVLPEQVALMGGDPDVYAIGCEGLVAQSQRLPDGRYNIVLAGTHRFRILSEPPRPEERLYRVAEVERLDDPFPPDARPRASELRARIVELVGALVRRSDPERAEQINEELFTDVDDVTFVNSLCNALAFPPSEKQGLLEADSVLLRFERLEGLLSFRMAELQGPGPPGSQSLH